MAVYYTRTPEDHTNSGVSFKLTGQVEFAALQEMILDELANVGSGEGFA